MHRLQKVIHRLYGVEGFDGYLNEDGDPVGHGTVPKTGQFQCFQLATVLRFVGDETCVRVNVVR